MSNKNHTYPELTEQQIALANSFNEVANEFVSILSNQRPIYDESYDSYTARLGADQTNSLISTQAVKKLSDYDMDLGNHRLLNTVKAAAQPTTVGVISNNIDLTDAKAIDTFKRTMLEALFSAAQMHELPAEAWKNPHVKVSIPLFNNL